MKKLSLLLLAISAASFQLSFGMTVDDYVARKINGMYAAEACGICKKTGGTVLWWSPYSRSAHDDCCALLDDLDRNFYKAAAVKYPGEESGPHMEPRHRAHSALIAKVERKLIAPSETTTIKDYIRAYGIGAIAALYSAKAEKLKQDVQNNT